MASAKVTFPNDAGLVQFLRSAKRCAGRSVIADGAGFDKTYNELVADVLRMRDVMRERLPPSALDDRALLRADAPYVCVLGRASYEMVVACLAIRALGGACVPLSSGVMPEEAAYFIELTKSSCLLAGQGFLERARETTAFVKGQGEHLDVLLLPISCDASPLEDLDGIGIDDAPALDPYSPGLIIFTSGTTGRPKGVVLPRMIVTHVPDGAIGSEYICTRPAHWLGGLHGILVPPIIGTKVHISELASAEQILDILLKNDIDQVGFTPAMLRQMKEYVESKDLQEQERLLSRLSRLKAIYSAGCTPSPKVVKFWQSRTGVPFINLYSATELGSCSLIKLLPEDGASMATCIGAPHEPDTQAKLTEGDHGELLIKSPRLFSHYFGAEEETKAAFDEDGFFKTGDYVELRDGEYYFCGRVSADYIRWQRYSIPTLQVEMALIALPYISFACVLGVPDHEAKEICGAVVRLSPDAQRRQSQQQPGSPERITLASICEDLRPLLPQYMHPRVLRLIDAEDDVPQTPSQKPIKRLVIEKFFGVDGYWDAESPSKAPGVEWHADSNVAVQTETRPWDWNGLAVAPEAST